MTKPAKKPTKKAAKKPRKPKTSSSDMISAIAAIDSALSVHRSVYMGDKDPEARAKARTQIDKLLDQRFPLMKRRDELDKA